MLDREQLPELIAFMQEQTKRYADEPRAWRLLGAAFLRAKKYPEAEHALRRAVALPPDSADALTQLGMALYYQDGNADAESFFRRALRLQPEDAAAMFGIGLCEVEKQDWPAAIEAFRQASTSKPDWVRPYMGLGDSLTKNGQPEMAIAPLDRAVALEPQNAQARALLDEARRAAGK